ncbi:autotransporter adhesin [Hydrogenimonas sp.]|nr:autotransporter adhesin [Hydrogenimonas sp.]
MRNMLLGSAVLASLLYFTGCGSVDNNTSTIGAASTGVLVDAPVAGVDYECSGGKNGVTGTNGEFQFNEGDTCKFSIGSLPLGDVLAKTIVTPKDLLGTQDFNDTKVLNLAKLLWALDSDGNVTNGIQIDSNITESLSALSLATDDPDDIFDAFEDYIEDIAEALGNDIDAEISMYNDDDILKHLEKSEMEAEYAYTDLPLVALSRDHFTGKTFYMDDDITLTFNSNGSFTEVYTDDGVTTTFTGGWTIAGDRLVLIKNSGSGISSEFIVFTEITDTYARFIAFLSDDVEGGTAMIVSSATATDGTAFNLKSDIKFSDFANKQFTTADGVVSLYPDGSYTDIGSEWSIAGSWTIVDNYLVLNGKDTTFNSISFAGVDANNTSKVYIFSENGASEKNVTISDLNSTLPERDVTNRVALSKDLFSDKKIVINDTILELEADGEYKEKGSNYEAEGSWTILDNYLVLTGRENYGSPIFAIIAFSDINAASATFTIYSADGVESITSAPVSVLEDD